MDQNTDKNKEFLEAYDTLSPALFRRFSFKLSDKEKALDLVQETFTKVWQCLVIGKEIRNLHSFIYTIANNMIVDEYRKKKPVSLDALQDSGFDLGEEAQYRNIFESVEFKNVLGSIERLPLKYKEVITMRYIDGLELSEIAGIIEESENVVSVRLNRGIKKIQKLLHIQ